MTKLFEQGVAAVKALPPDRQDLAGEFLLRIAGQDAKEAEYTLSPEQLADLDLAIAEADRGEFASDETVAAMWKKFGR